MVYKLNSVAEVSARFSLDELPDKNRSIDGDTGN